MLQTDLEYDPALYQRDRGELDWDQRSMSSATLLDSPTPPYAKGGFYAGDNASVRSMRFQGYDRYLANGPKQQSDIELTPLEGPNPMDYYQASMSQQSLLPATPSLPYSAPDTRMMREAPIHRPQERSYTYSDEPLMSRTRTPRPESPHQQYPPQYRPSHSPSPSQQYFPQHQPQQRSYSPSPMQQRRHPSHTPSPSAESGNPNFAGRGAYRA